MKQTSPIDRSRLSVNRTSVGQRLLSSWFRMPALWSLISLCTATALVLMVHAARPENDHIEPNKTVSLLVDATRRDGNDVMLTVANTISGTVFDGSGNPIISGRTIKLIQNGTLSGATATSNGSGIYNFTGLTLTNGDKIAVYISGASEKAATVTFTGTSDITTLNIYQSQLVVRSDNGSTIDNAGLKSALGATSDSDLLSVSNIDTFNVVTTPPGIGLQIWTGTIYAPGANINDGGNWINNGTFTAGSNTVNFNGVNNQTIKGLNSTTFNNLTIANTGDPNIPSNIVSLDGSAVAPDTFNTVVSHLIIADGVFDQGTGSASSNLVVNGTAKCIEVKPGKTLKNHGKGDETISCDVFNEGTIDFNGNGNDCGEADAIQIRSDVNGTQRTWEGPGTFAMTDVDVQDQRVPGGGTLPLQILVSSSTNSGHNAGWTFTGDTCTSPYTWIGGPGAKWIEPVNWSPVRFTANNVNTSDVVIFDGSVTPAPVIESLEDQTNAAILLKNGVFVTLHARSGGATLTLNGTTGTVLDMPAGTLLTLADQYPLVIRLTAPASGSVHPGQVAGQIIMKDDKHQLIGDNAGEISITGGLTIADTYSAITHPFGSGTNDSVVFQSGSTGTFNAGLDPFGGIGHSVVTFNAGSTAHFSAATAFFGGGETYGNLILDGVDQSYFLAGSDQTTILNNFRLVAGNSFVLSSTPGADVNLFGDFRDETVLAGQFQANGRTFKLQGTTQTIFSAGSLGQLSSVSIAQTPGGKVQLLSSTRINGQLTLTNADSLLELNGHTLELPGTITGPGNLKGDPNASMIVGDGSAGDLGTVNFLSGGRTLSSLQLNHPNGSMTLGTDLALTGGLRLDNGLLNTGANTLSLSSASSVLRTNGFVIGNLQKSFGASGTGSFTFPLGTANAYSPLDANVTANTNGTLTAKAVQGQQPNTPGGANALQRYWTLSGSGITADLTFHYRGGAPAGGDVVGSEGNYKVIKYDGSFTQVTPDATGSNSATDHFATLNNVSSFSDWTLAEPFAVQSGTISFLNAPYSDNETNANHNVTITVQRLAGSAGVVAVHYATGDGAATAGSDYTSVSGDLTWADGDTADKTFAIPILGDTTFELDETVNITLSAPTGGATIVGTNPATLTITNDDAADTDISVSAGNLVVSDGNGGNSDDALTLSLRGPNVRINDPNHSLSCGGGTPIDTHTCEIPFSSITGNIQVNTLGGIDTLTLALAGGNFFPPGGVIYNGGSPATAPGDKLIITGGNQGTVTYHYNNAHDGTIGMSNIGTVTFTGLEPISNTGLAADIIFELPPGPNSATLGDDGTAGNTISRLSGVTFETTDFSNPTGSLTIKRDSAADTVTVGALPDFNASLAIGSVANPFSTITVGGPITLTGASAVTLMAGDVSGSGNISTGGGLTVGVTGPNSTLSGVISGAGGLTKLGAGTLVVSGADTYTGATTVGAGRLNVNGSIASNVTVTATGTLGGAGSINSANTLTVIGGAIAPGASPGILNTGNVSFANASNLQIEIGGPTPGNAASNHDQLNVTGTISLGNPTLILSSFNGFVPSAGQSFVIINNDGSDAVSGTFSGLAEGTTITNFLGSSLNATITYAGGTNSNDVVVLTVVPFCNAAPVVTNTGDNGGVNPAPAAGTGTLRQALVDVCAGGTITFDTAGVFATPRTITLSNQLTIGTDNVTIDGPDPATQRVTIAGGGASRLFSTQSGKTATIRDLTITGGSAPGANGGAIFNDHATLTLIGVTVSNSTANFGGGIYSDGSSGSATLTIVNSTISGNTTHFGEGGGIYNFGPTGNATLNLTNSTISGNSARGNGGGVISNGPTAATPVTITNCTITNNRANNQNDSGGQGGGVTAVSGTPLILRNSIIDLNFRGPSPSTTPDDISAAVVPPSSSTHNLIGNCFNPCLLTNGVNNNQLNVSAASLKIGPLAANGAINQTHALLPGSIALEAGNNAYVVAPPFLNVSPFTDERGTGFPRIADTADADAVGTVDIGAFELHPTIEDITNKTTPEDTPLSFNFNIGDGTGAMITSVTAASSNTVLVPNDVGHLTVTGSGSTRTLNVTPAADANSPTNGTATITVTVTATSGQTAQDTFVLTVTEVNDAPVPTNDSLTAVAEDSGQRIIPFGNLLGNDFNRGAANESGQAVTVTAVSNAVGGTVTLDTPNSRVLFAPAADFNGAASFLYQVTDNGTTNGSLDAKSGTATASFTVNPINDPPTLTTNATLSVSNGGLRLIRNTRLKVDDVDNTATQLVYTIGTVPANGTLRISGVELFAGGTFTQDDINNNRLTYQHNGGATGSDSFTFTYSDGIVAPIGPNTFNVNICPNKLVTNTNDSGAGSLRQATLDVCDGGTISFDTAGVFSTPQTITLSSQLTVGIGSDDVTIDGPDPAGQRVTINGGGTTRLFTIQSGKTATIRDLTLTGGSALGPSPANQGGAIFNDHATLSLAGVTVSGNMAEAGGAVFNNGGAPNGAGVATLTIIDSTISGNTATFSSGGAIYNTSSSGNQNGARLNLTNSTLSGNTAQSSGGGVFSDGVSGLTLVNITNSTITDNRGGTGGGLLIAGGTTLTLRNSIVDLNFVGNTTNASDIVGPVVTAGASTHNLVGSCVDCGLTAGVDNNQLNVSAASLNIGALAANGAINRTHALLPGSIAIETGNDVTTLNGGIDIVQSSIILTNATAFPAGVGFVIRIDDEQMIVNDKPTPNSLTVTRGANGTTAVSHNSGAGVSPAFDERGSGFLRLVRSHLDIGAFEAAHNAPSSADNARTFEEDNNYIFTIADFPFSDPDSDTFTNVKIISLATAGALFFDSDGAGANPPVAVTLNQLVPVADISAGHLFFTPAADGSGTPYATFQFAVQDDGGAANGGSNLSTNYTFTMNVTEVNDAPSFQLNGNPTVNEDAGLQTVSGFATNFQPGPPTATNEAGQTLVGYTLSLTGSTGGLTFSSGPAIDNAGTLTYTPAANASGTATFSVVASDSGSGTAPNVNQSAPLSFTITVNAQNDAPTLTTNAGLSVGNGGTAAIDNTRLRVEDVDNTATELVYTIGTAPANGTLNKNGVDLSGGGTFTQDDIDNSLITYTHNGSAILTDSFTFTVSDGAGGAIGATTFNINIGCGNGITVTSNADSGDGTLRQAIAGICDGGTITFDMSQVVSPITLTSGLTINKNLTIQGPGANLLTITGNDTFGLIKANTAGINVNIDGLSFTHGGPDAGNAVAIEFVGGTLTVSNCEFSANTGAGKALLYSSLSTGLTLRASTLGNNTTLNTILSDRTPLAVVNSTISNNSGAAINNSAVGSTVLNSTIADNGTGVQSDGSLCGGCAASVTVTNSLFSSNGGQNLLTTGGGTITSGGHNLIDDATAAAFTNPADPTNIIVAPGTAGIAAALANNGGPTRTRALVLGTLALDAGDNTAATNAGLTNDQRGAGFNRIADGPDVDTITTVDIGAFEGQLSVTNATTNEGIQTTSGLEIRRDAAQGVLPTHFKITAITNGTLFQNNGTTQINNGDFITVAEGNAGLKFTPAANLFSPATTFSFQAQASSSNSDAGLIIGVVTATITVNPIAGTPSVTNATTTEDTQNISGLVISINAGDGAEVTHFKITGITNGRLFKNDGTTVIVPNSFITVAEGNAGLKFRPRPNLFSPSTTFSFQVQAATSNTGTGLSAGLATATITVNPVADTPSVTSATTSEDIQTTSGLVISRNAADGAEVTHFKITGITNGTLFKNDGTTQINNNDFITFAEGNAGLKFRPALNLFSPSTTFSFQTQAATSNTGTGLSGGVATATITVNPVADTPAVTSATTNEDIQTTLGLVISRNAADSAEVTHFKITGITNGTLFKNDGTTVIANNSFITFAEGNAGLKFTPGAGLFSPGTPFSFQVQASLSNSNGGLGGGLATPTITVNAQNDAPTLTTNAGLSVGNGGTGTIDSIRLKVEDVDNTATELVYTIGTAPANGTLKKNGVDLTGGGTFTQADINNGLITYQHNSSATFTDSFTFTVSDGAGGAIGSTTFNINVGCGNSITVTSNADNGNGTLRQAIAGICDGGTITFDMSQVASPITLTSGLTINKNLTIQGPGANLLTITGNDTFGLLKANTGGINVNIDGLSFTHGGPDAGNAVAIEFVGGGTLTISNCEFAANTDNSLGKAVIYTSLSTGLTVKASTLGNNTTLNAILSDRSPLTVVNSTISNNSGTAINSSAVGSTVLNSTIADNGIGVQSDGSLCGGCAASVTVTNSLFSSNGGQNIRTTGGGTITSGGHNLLDDATAAAFTNPADPTNIIVAPGTAGIAAGLANNGGPTRTRVLVAGTLALDAGDNTAATNAGLTNDQRGPGFNRIADGPDVDTITTVDIGAFEAQLSVTNATTNESIQTTSGLVIRRDAAQGVLPTHFKITGITNGTLFKNDGTTVIVPNSFITVAEGNAGLKFTPTANLFSPATTFSFQAQASSSNSDAGLIIGVVTATITVNPIAGTPSVTNATTTEDTQNTSGLVISINAADGAEVTHFKITGITNGTLFKNDGTSVIVPNSFITFTEGNAGLKFTPGAGLFSPGTSFSFQVQAATSNTGTGLSGGVATATVTVNPVADTPSVTSATTNEDIQTTSGLVISRNVADGAEVTHFKITGITNGTLFKNDGTTVIANNSFITFAEGSAGLKFTPGAGLFSPGTSFSFQVQASLSNSDAGLGGSLAIATITVNAQNDAPTLATNAGLSVGNGGTGTIDNTNLKVEDVDNTAIELVYTIGTAPANGTLKKNGVDLSGGGTFTQDDIDNSLITYQHNGSAILTDSFTFTVFDGAGGSIGSTTFNINIGCGNSITVTSNADSGDGTLRQAIAGICDGGTITFDMNQVVSPITLTSGLTINKNLTIQGPGANLLTITGNDTFGLIKANTAGINVNIDGLSFTHGGPDAGNAVAIEFVGGGTSTVSSCEFAANTGASKAVIYTSQSTGLTLRASTFGNNATLNTILSDRTPLTVVNSTISNNSGPGINNSAAGSAVTNSTIANNGIGVQSDGGLCGGCAASVTVTNSLLSSNGGQNIRTTGGGTITSSGHNLLDDATSAAFTNPADPTNIIVAPGTAGIAATLANNGGPIRTRALVAGTLALDAGDNTAATNAGLTNDQRGPGFNRIADGPDVDTITTVDIGAFEAQLSVTNATTKEGIQTTAGLVIRRDAAQGVLPTHFKITGITNGTLFQNNGTTQINSGDFITVAEGNAGLKFTPAANLFSPATTFSFQAQASSSNSDAGLIIGVVTATITVNPIAGTPSVTNATTVEDTLTGPDLVISINAADGGEVTHFKITGITNGRLFQNDGTTVIVPNAFITVAEGNAGLKFRPRPNLFSPSTTFSFQVQAATSNTGTGLSAGFATATITVNPVADTPSVTGATTNLNTQTTAGLVISRNAADGAEVTHLKITGITNGTLFKNNGTTQINNNDFITFAEGNAGLKFTPGLNSTSAGSFDVQAATSNTGANLSGTATATITVGCGSTTVTNSNDSGAGSLRSIINGACAGATITFDMTPGHVTSPIKLTSGELLINKNLTIRGPGANLLTISGNNASRVFNIAGGATVTIDGLTIANGRASDGAGIWNSGTLTLNRCLISGNNSIGSFGGGILNRGVLLVTDSTISGNASASRGAGLQNLRSPGDQPVTATLIGSTISGNTARSGAGIHNEGASLILTNCTVSGNTANSSDPTGSAGGLENVADSFDTTAALTNCTFNGNRQTSSSGPNADDIYSGNFGKVSTVTLRNTILGGSAATATPNISIFTNGVVPTPGVITSLGGNLSRDNGSGFLSQPNDLINTNPLLAPLGSYGGTTATHALLPGSPALNAGNNCVTDAAHCGDSSIAQLTTDQRGAGFNRVVGSAVDVGAFESRGFTISIVSGTPQSTLINTPFALPLVASIIGVGGEPVAGGIIAFTAPATGASATLTGGTATASAPIDANGKATTSATANAIGGSYNVNATAAGVTSVSFALTNNKVNSATAVASSLNPSDLGQSVTFTASVTSVMGTPTGTVQFKDGGADLGAPVALNVGAAQVSTSSLASGTHIITAEYSGDGSFLSSTGTLSGGQVVGSQASLSIDDVSVAEGNAGTTVLTFTITLAAASNLPISVDYSTANGTATAGSDYVAIPSTLLTFNPGDVSKQVSVSINGDINLEADETFFVNLSNPVNATISDNQGVGTILNDDAQGGIISFSQANYNVDESTGIVTVTVTRSNDLSQAAQVDYATDDTGASIDCAALNTVLASQRCDYTSVFGTLKFAANETQKTIDIPVNLDAYNEGPETFTVKLSNPTGGAFLAEPSTAIVTINDSASPTLNAIDDTTNFVRQQYHDFLNRDADPAGLAFWKNNIDKCNDPAQLPPGQTLAQCIEVQRILTSAAFFLSIEFKETGGLVRYFYVAALDRPLTNNMPDYVEFMRDTQAIQKDLVVGQGNWQQLLDANRQAFMDDFVMRGEFVALYPTTDTPTEYVDKLYQHANVAPVTVQERLDAILEFGGAPTAADPGARGRALLRITQNGNFRAREATRTFVHIEYFGYLRRNPNDSPDNNFNGYDFWVNKLNQVNGNFLDAEMVKAFLNSIEYRKRFGP